MTSPAVPARYVYKATPNDRRRHHLKRERAQEQFLRNRAIDRARLCKTKTARVAWVELARDHNRRLIALRREQSAAGL